MIAILEVATQHQIAVAGLAVVVAVLLLQLLRVGSRPADYPPGPPTLPILGNLHQIPKKDVHLQYQKWAKEYGPIFSLKLGQQTTVVLADGIVIRELVDARGSNYADRPDLWVRGLFEHSRIIMRGYDDLWRVERKLYHALLNINVAKKYLPYQELETLKLCVDFLDSPDEFVLNIGRMTGSIASSITYGMRLPDKTHSRTLEMLHNSHGFFQCVVQSQYFDWFPSLRPLLCFVPNRFNPLAKSALDAYFKERANFKKYYEMGLSGDLPCFAREIAAAQTKWKGTQDGDLLTDHAASYIAGVSFEGGADTTRYTLQGFVKAMAMNPDVQQRAQTFIDSVVGENELPSSKHIANLGFVNALAKETIRWMPTAINGAIPHATLKEDHYRGFRIPQGATIVLAVWSANHDEKYFPDPRKFDPDRQQPNTSLVESATAAVPSERGQWGFGSGRRMCPGMHVASNTLIVAIARIVWAFHITMAEDSAGNPIPIDRDAMVGGLAAAPAPFKCKIRPRNATRAALIEREWNAVSAECLSEDGSYSKNILD